MPFNIETFKTNIDRYGYLQNNKYEARVFTPPFLGGGIAGGADRIASILRFRIDSVRAPGIQLLSADNNRYGVGPSHKQPINAQFNELSLSFIADENGELWQFWHNWLRGIFEFSSDATTHRQGQYASRYKHEYASNMQIMIFNNLGQVSKLFTLYEVFPTAINETSLSWNDVNQILRIGVSLSYREFTVE